MINIPMNTKPALDLGAFSGGSGLNPAGLSGDMNNQMNMGSQMGGYTGAPAGNNFNNMNGVGTMQNQGYGQPQQQNYGQQTQSYSQPQQNYNQQVPQQSYSQPVQPMQTQTKQRPAGGGVILKKGQKVGLTAGGAALTNIQVCLGWDIKNQACDLDASAFMLGANGKVIGDDWFVFYGQTVSPDGSVRHFGDSDGSSMGDDEIIDINLQTINPNVKKITFVVTINEALEKGLNFSMVANAYVRVVNKTTGQELNRFQLTDYYANVTSMVVGEVYNHNGQWKFNAVGDGVAKDLEGLCGMYGVNVAG